MPHLAFAQEINEATEPTVRDVDAIDLLEGGTLDAPSTSACRRSSRRIRRIQRLPGDR